MGKLVQRLKELAARDFPPEFLGAEVLRLVLEGADPVQAFVGVQQGVALLFDDRRERLAEHTRKPLALTRHHPTDHLLQKSVPRRNKALVRQVLQDLAYNRDGLGRQHSDPLGLALQLGLSDVVTDVIVEQPENDPLLCQAGGFGWRRDACHLLYRKILLEDRAHIIKHCLTPREEELSLRFEVAELQRQMYGDRCGASRVDHRAFGRTHVEIQAPVFCSETRQAIQVVDFLGGQDREAAGIDAHGMVLVTACIKYTFRTATVPD